MLEGKRNEQFCRMASNKSIISLNEGRCAGFLPRGTIISQSRESESKPFLLCPARSYERSIEVGACVGDWKCLVLMSDKEHDGKGLAIKRLARAPDTS